MSSVVGRVDRSGKLAIFLYSLASLSAEGDEDVEPVEPEAQPAGRRPVTPASGTPGGTPCCGRRSAPGAPCAVWLSAVPPAPPEPLSA
eukprot:13358761-Alexandrium_andersonii.AAC.1